MEVTRRGCAAVLLAGALFAPGAAAEEPGKAKYHLFCESCHGASGDGKGPASTGLKPPPTDFTTGVFRYGTTDQDLFEVISNGAASKGGSGLMSGWSPVIPEADRWALVRYVRSFKKASAVR